MKLLKHSWIKQDGFKTYKCEHCGVVRKWDNAYQSYVFEPSLWGRMAGIYPPECKRIFHNDKI